MKRRAPGDMGMPVSMLQVMLIDRLQPRAGKGGKARPGASHSTACPHCNARSHCCRHCKQEPILALCDVLGA